MYSTTSKPQEGSTCKDSLPKCFMTTNPTAKVSRGAVNRGEVLRTCFHLNFYTSIKQYILNSSYSAEISLSYKIPGERALLFLY